MAGRKRIETYAGLPDLLKKILCDALWNTADGSGSLFVGTCLLAVLIVDE